METLTLDRRLDLPPAEMRCPKQGCERTFTCDACLHTHLVRRYKVRYAEVFGRVNDAWVEFCDDHADCSPSMLG